MLDTLDILGAASEIDKDITRKTNSEQSHIPKMIKGLEELRDYCQRYPDMTWSIEGVFARRITSEVYKIERKPSQEKIPAQEVTQTLDSVLEMFRKYQKLDIKQKDKLLDITLGVSRSYPFDFFTARRDEPYTRRLVA